MQTLETPILTALVDPDCAKHLNEWEALPAATRNLNLSWQVASSRGAVKDRLLKDKTIQVVLVSSVSDADPLLRDLARNAAHLCGRKWLHVVLLAAELTPPLVTQLRQFSSWSVLAAPCGAEELCDALHEAAEKAAEQHRLTLLSAAIRADAEDILTRTRNIVGALQNVEMPAAFENLTNIAERQIREDSAPKTQSKESSELPEAVSYTAMYRGVALPADGDRHWTRSLIDLCMARQHFFPDGLFSDPAWDMLLDLTYARLSGKRVSVSSLCIASRVPATTALRRIGDIVVQGLATRIRDESDGRRVFVELTDDGFSRMMSYIGNARSMLAGETQQQIRKA